MEHGARAPLPRSPRRPRLALGRFIDATRTPIEFQILGRVLLQAALVGAAAGLMGSLFFAGVEAFQRVVLESTTGYLPLRAGGERILGDVARRTPFRPWLLVVALYPRGSPPRRAAAAATPSSKRFTSGAGWCASGSHSSKE
jgi:hypothetical protein